jgi:protocatechuate 3,4-dioxygenase beta subunit
MKALLLMSCLYLTATGCTQGRTQNETEYETVTKAVGGPCEGCEAIFESPVPLVQLNETDTLQDFNEPGPKLKVSGTVYKQDGKTPAPNVVLYVYHTNQEGIYPKRGDETGWGWRHGYIRGWVKTNSKGQYAFYTLKPATYPSRTDPAHIHITVKEPDKNEYYIDDFLFDDDPLLTAEARARQQERGGNGIVRLQPGCGGVLTATRNIVLGKNIPGYPKPSSDVKPVVGLSLLFVLH